MGAQKNRLDETVLLSTKTYAKNYGQEDNYNFTLNIFVLTCEYLQAEHSALAEIQY